MPRKVSLYDAKAQLSALVRQVREGSSIVITVHGEPAAELRPVTKRARRETLAQRIAALEAEGVIEPATRAPREFNAILKAARVPRRRGAAARFLSDRGD